MMKQFSHACRFYVRNVHQKHKLHSCQATPEHFLALSFLYALANKCAMAKHRISTMSFARIYALYVAKAERKGRTKAEVDTIICWLTGYSQQGLLAELERETDVETFIAHAPKLNPARLLIKGVVCGVRVEAIKEPMMREIRYLDKLIDELAKGKSIESILRKDE